MSHRLLSAEIEGYRCLERVTFQPAKDRTVLVGANGSGKTSVLDAIAFVADLVRHREGAISGERRGSLGVKVLPFSRILRSGAERAAFVLEVEIDGARYRWELALGAGQHGGASIERERLRREDHEGPVLLLERDLNGARARRPGERGPSLVPVGQQPLTPTLCLGEDALVWPELHPFWRYVAGICLIQPVPVLMRGAGLAEEAPPLPDRYGRDLSARVHRFLTTRARQLPELLHSLGGFVGWTDLSAPVRGGSLEVEFHEAGLPGPLSLLTASDGTVVEAWLALLTFDLPEGLTFLLVDEPGGELFGEGQQRTAELLRALSASCQLAVATHAVGLTDELSDIESTVLVLRQPGEGARLVPLSTIPGIDRDANELGLAAAAFAHAPSMLAHTRG